MRRCGCGEWGVLIGKRSVVRDGSGVFCNDVG